MASVCYDCKLGYGHQLIWCPGCGRSMKQVKMVDWKRLQANGWRLEGDDGLLEYFLNGFKLEPKKRYEALVGAIREEHPGLWEALGLANYDETNLMADTLKFQRNESTRTFELRIETKPLLLYIRRPCIRYRLVGSDLEVDPVPATADQFDEGRL